ncbi:hypothetical protein EV363DRAFT_1350515 [Boletus edulis]|nr:hypothetical protein EV363DRAFT_1350515 [Boletus edulis]
MSSSRSAETTYENQNDQRLDELHSKITTDIYDDTERQNLTLDETGNSFSSFSSQLSHSSRRAAQAFGLAGARQTRIIMYVVVGFLSLWLLWRTKGFGGVRTARFNLHATPI